MPPSTTVNGTNLHQRRDATTNESDRLPSNVSAHDHEGSVIILSSTPLRWHPKLTPYRVFTLLVGTGLCILKAVLVSKNVQVASITVEWVLGTLLVILSYSLDTLERHLKDISVHLWFFNYDCMNVLWSIFTLLRMTPPDYSTVEEPDSNGRIRPVTTNYRLLVSVSVVVFGIVKAALAYRNISNGANTLDWIFGAVVTTVIFFTGLYENNPTQKGHVLFDRDDSPTAFFIGREGFLIATSLLITCIPIYIFSLGQKVFHFYLTAFNEPFEIKKDQDWGIYITVHAGYILMMGAVIFVEYNSLFIPIASILILRRYFQPNSALVRRFEALVQRYERLQHLVPTDRTINLISACFAELISTGIALNAIMILTFCLAGALAMFTAAVGLALFVFIPLRIESLIGPFMIASTVQSGYVALTILSSLRRRILAFRRVGKRDTQTQVGLA